MSVDFRQTYSTKSTKTVEQRIAIAIEVVHTFSQPSGGSRAKKRFIRGDASVPPDVVALSSGDVLWLSSAK